MNITIISTYKAKQKGIHELFRPIVRYPFTIVSLILFIILFVSESYYRTRLHGGLSVIYIGGIASLIGFVFVMYVFMTGCRMALKYIKEINSRKADSYITLTDEYVEQGVRGIWSQRYYWCLLHHITENGRAYVLGIGKELITIYKSDLEDETVRKDLISVLETHRPEKSRQGLRQAGN